MKFLAALLLLCASGVALHAQSPVQIVRGRVVADDTGNPLPHARVVVYNDATPLPPLFTDADGRFESKPLTTGRYRLSVTKTGYSLTSVARLDAASPDAVDVRMPRAASITGRVLDPYGEPVIGLAVSIGAPPPEGTSAVPTITKIAFTDDTGDYRIGGLAAGSYIVAVHTLFTADSGMIALGVSYYPGVPTAVQAQRMQLQPGDQKAGIDFSDVTTEFSDAATATRMLTGPGVRTFVAPPAQPQASVAKGTGTIRGRVTRTDGSAIARATVMTGVAESVAGVITRYVARSVRTDDDGNYEFVDLPEDGYRIRATKAGFIGGWYGQQTTAEPPVPVKLADNQTRTRIDIVLPRYSAITGQVSDDFGDPVDGVSVSVSQIRFQAGRRHLAGVGAGASQTDDLGRYRIFGLQPGQYVVTASVGQLAAGFAASADVSGFAPTYFPGAASANDTQLVTVPRSQDVVGVDIGLVPVPTARISGKRLRSDGTPLGGSLVLTPSQRSGAIVTLPIGARTEQDGRFEFPNVPPGDYVIQAGTGKSDGSAEGEFVSRFVTVGGTDITDLLLQPTPGSTVRGRVVFEGDSTPPPLQDVVIVPMAADLDLAPITSSDIARAPVQRDLTFRMTGIHGPRRLTVNRAPSGWALKSVIANGIDVTDMPLPFGTNNQSLDNVQVIFTSRVTELRGTVADARGQAISEYALLVFPSDHGQWYPGSRYLRRVAPELSGGFAVGALPPGDYYVAPVAGGASVLSDGADAWQDPEFLETIALRATRATLTEGQKLSLSVRLVTP